LQYEPTTHEMFCQLCLVRLARRRVTLRSPSGKIELADYWVSCYEAKFEKPPPDVRFPRPRITIKSIMIFVCVMAVLNAATVWMVRSSSVSQTPEQLRQWTIHVFVAPNLCLATITAWQFVFSWVVRVYWFNRTGGLVPMPESNVFLAVGSPLSVREWRLASWQERASVGASIAPGPAWILAYALGGKSFLSWGTWPWSPIPAGGYILLVASLAGFAALAFSVRRR
jgi:hypothetical protein